MRIIECYIENFGKISKQKFEFKAGFNCFNGENGTGKTTLAAFIKAMLYGFNDTKKLSLEENDRKHYMPWGGGPCGGSLTFSVGEKIYRVERSFSPKSSDDSFVVYDTSNGRATSEFQDGIGESLFGIDADGFERTVFLSERVLTPKSDNKSISAKLSDLVGCDGDIGGMDEAMKVLENQRKFYYKKGGSGELADTKSRINEITRKLDSISEIEIALEATHQKMREISDKLDKARATSKDILKEREELTVKAAEVNFEKRFNEIKLSLEQSLKMRTAVSEVFGANLPTYKEIDEASYKAVESENLIKSCLDSENSLEFKALSAKFDGKAQKTDIERAREAITKLNESKIRDDNPELRRAKKIFASRIPSEDEISAIEALLSAKKSFPLALACYIVFAILLILGIVVNPILTVVGGIGMLITAIVHIVYSIKTKKDRSERVRAFFNSVSGVNITDVAEALERLKDMKMLLPTIRNIPLQGDPSEYRAQITALSSLFDGEDAEDIIKAYDRYTELALAERYIRVDKEAKIQRAEQLKKETEDFLRKYKTLTADPFSELRASLTEYDRLTAEIVAKRDELERLESQNRLGEDNHKRTLAEIEAVNKKQSENDALIAELSREYTLLERSYKAYTEEIDSRDELYMRRAELEDILKKHTDNYDTLLLTKKYLTLAKDNMTSRYLGKTKDGFLKYTEIIGGISGESFEMDTDFSITKQEGATTKGVDAYSRGTRDLFNLAARLALVDSLYENEKPFIILDDPFTALDDGKIKAALDLLKQFAKERQVIYFTCSKSRSIQA